MGPAIAIVGLVGFVVGIYFLAKWLEQKRTDAVHGWASTNGFNLDPDWNGFHGSLQQFKLFNQGHSRRLRNLCRTTRGDDQLAICDYQYTTGSGKHQHTYQQTICVVQPNKPKAMPHFFARKQMAFFDAVGKLFGGQDINFDEDPEFSKAYVLQTGDSEAELRRLFDERTRSVFTRLGSKGVQVEGLNGTLLFHYGRRLKIERINELVDDALAVQQALR